MRIDVAFLPDEATAARCAGMAVAVFDVLRATTTIAAALAAGVSEIRLFASISEARAAGASSAGPVVLCGEEKCIKPPGFDLGNSPRAFSNGDCHGKTLYMITTNGTRAILAARDAARLFTGALVNARAVASRVAALDLPVLLLCSGTNGQVALEDVLGAGAVIDELAASRPLQATDAALIAHRLFQTTRRRPDGLLEALRQSTGGRNILAAGLDDDLPFAAELNSLDIVAEVKDRTITVAP